MQFQNSIGEYYFASFLYKDVNIMNIGIFKIVMLQILCTMI